MKKIVRKLSFASLMIMATAMPAMAAPADDALCGLIKEMMKVFKILRTLAFIGAAFLIANWAWGYIKDSGGKEGVVEDLKKKGTGLLVGFTLLFGIGVVLSFLMSQGGQNMIGCGDVLANWGN